MQTQRIFLVNCVVYLGCVAYWGTLGSAFGADLVFRRHVINAESTYSACAAVDVNRDGQLDIFCGGWWYEAPHWKHHFVRDVEIIRGRFDGYSNLPLDVNADGWTDLISANYRSQKLYWIEHPGKALGEWRTHQIAMPGPMETARLVDVDGDGRIDVLPNGVRFAAWWELKRGRKGPDQTAFQWIRHELPKDVAGHGVGFGDINDDGRGDIVSTGGWLEASEDRRRQRWQWHPEFQLHRDGSIPMLVFDVDGDGDNDIVWSNAHHTGLYWLEQRTSTSTSDRRNSESEPRNGNRTPAERRWRLHVIDTSWSQAHALLLGDLDQDGRPEVVAGKRYMGHDGKDPGEYDPMLICAYTFDRKTRAWRRKLISADWKTGFGLDPKLVDLDGDGDLDILGPGRSGLYWLENLLIPGTARRDALPPTLPAASYQDHVNIITYKDEQGQNRPVTSPAEWAHRRAHILSNMQLVMGGLPDSSRRVPLDIQVTGETQMPKYVRRKLTFAAEPNDRVPAYLLIPNRLRGKAPAMLCLHQTTQLGKDEPAGLGGRQTLFYAHELANRGYVCIVPDYPSFGEYQYDFSQSRKPYLSGSMKAVWNNIRAVDVLETLAEVDRNRIGCIGHSLGAHNAIFTAPFDLRIQAVISSCGFSDFHDDDVPSWTGERYMPRIRDVFGNDPDRVPFDFHELLAALAPRPVFVNAPQQDSDFDVRGVRKVLDSARKVYQLLDAGENLTAVYPESKHDFPDQVRQQAYDWLDKRLKPDRF